MILLDLTRTEPIWQLLLAEYERMEKETAHAENEPAEEHPAPPQAFGECNEAI